MTSSNGNIFRVTGHLCGEFTGQRWIPRPVTPSFDIFFNLRLNKRLSKHSWGWWFETPSRPSWRHCNAMSLLLHHVSSLHSTSRGKCISLQWRHNEHKGVSNHQPYDCLLNLLFRRRWKITSKLRASGLCEGNWPVTGEFPTQRPVMRKMFPFEDVIMRSALCHICCGLVLVGVTQNFKINSMLNLPSLVAPHVVTTSCIAAIDDKNSHHDSFCCGMVS